MIEVEKISKKKIYTTLSIFLISLSICPYNTYLFFSSCQNYLEIIGLKEIWNVIITNERIYYKIHLAFEKLLGTILSADKINLRFTNLKFRILFQN